MAAQHNPQTIHSLTPEQRQAQAEWDRIKGLHRFDGPCARCMGAFTPANRTQRQAEHSMAQREADTAATNRQNRIR
jgi:hypothetical protein